MTHLHGIISRLMAFPESDALKGLVRHRDSDAGARLTSESLNEDYIGGKRQPWIIGADDIVRDIASGKPLEFAAVVRRRITSDRTPLKVANVEGALDRDNHGARYVRAIAEAWGRIPPNCGLVDAGAPKDGRGRHRPKGRRQEPHFRGASRRGVGRRVRRGNPFSPAGQGDAAPSSIT